MELNLVDLVLRCPLEHRLNFQRLLMGEPVPPEFEKLVETDPVLAPLCEEAAEAMVEAVARALPDCSGQP